MSFVKGCLDQSFIGGNVACQGTVVRERLAGRKHFVGIVPPDSFGDFVEGSFHGGDEFRHLRHPCFDGRFLGLTGFGSNCGNNGDWFARFSVAVSSVVWLGGK